jgi:sigma-54 specific flagellar transcriptional regulator A
MVILIDHQAERRAHLHDGLSFLGVEHTVASSLSECHRFADSWDPLREVALIGDLGPAEMSVGLLTLFTRDDLRPPVVRIVGGETGAHGAWPEALAACCNLTMPFNLDSWREALHAANLWRQTVRPGPRFDLNRRLIGASPAMSQVRGLVTRVATSDATVLLLGESGTGKEVVARAIHDSSNRADKPFVPLNCGAIPSELLESEMFGHEKGAFTGALNQRMGRFELAKGGTLFLDEIGDMPQSMQVKLLRVLQERTFQRVGSNTEIEADVRIVAATHRNLAQRIQTGDFREDLFYRLNVFPIDIAPLRERIMDIPLLVSELMMRIDRKGGGTFELSAAAIGALGSYHWPGNVRELANLVERLALMHPGGVADVGDLPASYVGDAVTEARASTSSDSAISARKALLSSGPVGSDGQVDLRESVADVERNLILWALEMTDGVIAAAARRLNINRTTLVEKMRKYELPRTTESLEN